ncbi:hypothetical protein BKA82DRAFT_4014824 [Pisolithus tinctorius]|nr:hypothetical protein BKA82DRAFT_4014824 [Pisolithus tinctorius]
MSTVSDMFSFDNIDPTLLALSEHEPPAPKQKAEVPVPKRNAGDTGLGLEEFSHYVTTYEAILIHLPWLEDAVRACSLDSNDFTKITDKITTGMSEQRSMDLSTVKHTGLAYVPFNMDGKFIFDPPIPKTEDKSNQGVMAGLQDGSIPVTTFNWPMFFYEDSVYDPEDQLKGLFQGHIAWQCSLKRLCYKQHIKEIEELCLEPSESHTAYHCICTHNFSSCLTLTIIEAYLLRVTLHIIAYVHIIAYLTLSLVPKWANEFGDVDLQAMSWTIIKMFEHSDDWTHETLEWWNMYIVLTISMPNAYWT